MGKFTDFVCSEMICLIVVLFRLSILHLVAMSVFLTPGVLHLLNRRGPQV